MNARKYEIMEKYLKGEYTVHDMIEHIVQLEEQVKDLNQVWSENKPESEIKPKYVMHEMIIGDRKDAEKTLEALTGASAQFGAVTVADYYDLIGVTPNYKDNMYGWTFNKITEANILSVRGGYIIKFPPVEEVK